MNWFTKLENVNWTRLWWITCILSTFWIGLATIISGDLFKLVSVPLLAIQNAFLFAARGSKYVINRIEPPQDGKP